MDGHMNQPPSSPPSRALRLRLRGCGLSDAVINELAEDEPPVNVAWVCSLLEYGKDAGRLDTPAARRRELEKARIALAKLTHALERVQAWYREPPHVDYLKGDEDLGARQLRPVYFATGALLELLRAKPDDSLGIAADRASVRPRKDRGKLARRKSKGGRPRRPWLAEVRQGLIEAGCSKDRISELFRAAKIFTPKIES
jgi:hypothetical protein